MNNIRKIGQLLAALAIFSLSSCDDSRLAEAADGTWEGSFKMKDEYGTPFMQHLTYEFEHIKSGDTDGGRFTEYRTMQRKEQESGITVTYTLKYQVEGEWEIFINDLYLTYDLQSIEVTVEDLKCSSFFVGINYLTEEIRKNAYKMIYDDCEAVNNGEGCYANFEVDDNTLSFDTSDLGRMEFSRVDSGFNNISDNETEDLGYDDYNKAITEYFSGNIPDWWNADWEYTIETVFEEQSTGDNPKYKHNTEGLRQFVDDYLSEELSNSGSETEDLDYVDYNKVITEYFSGNTPDWWNADWEYTIETVFEEQSTGDNPKYKHNIEGLRQFVDDYLSEELSNYDEICSQ